MTIKLAFRPRQENMPVEEGSWHANAQGFELRLLADEASTAEALAMRNRAYAAIGYPIEYADGQSHDRFEFLPSTVLLGAYDGERLVASMRLCFSHPWLPLSVLPCAAYYPALAATKRREAGGLVEISRLAIDPVHTNTSYRTTLYGFMVRAAFTAARAAAASTILIATRPDWVKFYKYMMGFEQIGEPAFYPPGDFKITLLGGSVKDAQARQQLRNRFFAISDREVASMRTAIDAAVARFGDETRIAV